jgi:hypothetical protein
MDAGAPGRTRTDSLLFRRCPGLDAVLDCEAAGRQRPTDESYRVVGPSRFVTLSSEKAVSRYRAYPPYRRCMVPAGRSQPGRRSSGRFLRAGSLRRTLAYPSTAIPDCDALLWIPRGVEWRRRKGRFARWIHRRVRAFWPAFGWRRLPRQSQPNLVATHRVQRPYPPWSCAASTKMFRIPRLEITSSATAGVRARALRCCAPSRRYISSKCAEQSLYLAKCPHTGQHRPETDHDHTREDE